MKFLENINPNYIDLMLPLQDWKILSVEELKRLSEFPNGSSSFYKAIKKLESANLIKGFADSFTNQKFLYLLAEGYKTLGLEKMVPIHDENRFHDAHLVRVLLQLQRVPEFNDFLLDHQIKKEFPLLDHIPDAIIRGKRKEIFHLGVELELTQKSKDRIRETFCFYEKSPYFNNVIYLFNRATPFQTYQEVLRECHDIKNKDRFMFVFEPMLTRRNYEILKSETLFKGKKTTLEEIFTL